VTDAALTDLASDQTTAQLSPAIVRSAGFMGKSGFRFGWEDALEVPVGPLPCLPSEVGPLKTS